MNNVADKLYNLLSTKFDNTSIKTLDSAGKETSDMEEIEMFSFDFLVNSRDYGPVVILLSANENLEVYYGDNTSKSLRRDAKKKWENVIEHLSTFARSNRLGFSLKHTSDLKYDLSNITDITESYKNIFEGYYGTRKTSYSPQGKAKIIIKHSKAIGEGDQRFRNISQIFIENAAGERFKLPFKKLTGARAMARHVTEGGNPYDLFGLHICEMVTDINTLGGFVRRSKMYEGNDEAMGMVETGRTHYNALRKGLKTIAGKRGYNTYKEGWEPSAITEQDTDTTVIRNMFMDNKVNQRTEDALPLLARLQQMAEAQGLNEKAPPGMEDWIKSNKAEFIGQYGKEKGLEVLYATAWKRHNANESVDENLNEAPVQEYKGFKIEYSKPKGKKVAARARSHGGSLVAMAPGRSPDEAYEAIKIKLDEYIASFKRVSGKANVNLNAEFTHNHLKPGEGEIWGKLVPGPKLVVAGDDALELGPDFLRSEGEDYTRTGNRKPMASETGTDLLGFSMNPARARESQAIANGRYMITGVTPDRDGNKVYDLEFDSVVAATAEKVTFNKPALTVATRRGVGETMREVDEFKQWANNIVEGTWAFPDNKRAVDDLNAFMATEQPVGIDAINATDALHNIFGDDQLFDALAAAADDDPSTDARAIVKDHINDMHNNIDQYDEGTRAIIVNLYKAMSGEIEEGCGELDYDEASTQLNADANKDMDDYIQKEDVVVEADYDEDEPPTGEHDFDKDMKSGHPGDCDDDEDETTDLKELMQRTNFLLR